MAIYSGFTHEKWWFSHQLCCCTISGIWLLRNHWPTLVPMVNLSWDDLGHLWSESYIFLLRLEKNWVYWFTPIQHMDINGYNFASTICISVLIMCHLRNCTTTHVLLCCWPMFIQCLRNRSNICLLMVIPQQKNQSKNKKWFATQYTQ
jgi:hypothetical protein